MPGMQGMPSFQGVQGAQQFPMQPGAGYPTYPGQYAPTYLPGTQPTGQPPGTAQNGMLPLEESYIENILRLNRGKTATVYLTFEGNREWNAKVIKGVIEAAGRDHLILSDPQTGMRYLLLMVYLDYVTFDEEINYFPQNTLAVYPPR
ncbi:spore coat protein GerQ [Metabacillus sediminilitoris]|uniref:Spore coat protein GerQ n=2 Tax=Metabacillus sediminilitoris TaxID=2567941 RepID=A0A4S4BNA5_9BACI|nr:spore coat protein GerQ [Metabacillus sediminilitoris]THF76340.1 spore coat protein GerQ [Metabacillus sediminilitoris]